MKIVNKKIWPDMFENDRNLPVDFRMADFDLENGDKIRYREWNPKTREFTGREYIKTVKRVTKHESPTKYWKPKDLRKNGVYIIEFNKNNNKNKL